MKILQINAVYGYKSTGIIVKDIDELIQKSGNESFVAYQKCRTKPLNGYRVGNILDWKMHAFLSRILGKQAYFSKIETKKLIKWMDSVCPDVVHLHNLHSNYVNLPILLQYLAKHDIATVITLHDCWFFTGKCFHYVDINCDKFQSGCGDCPKKNLSPKSLLKDTSAQVLHDKLKYLTDIPNLKIIGCSKWICEEAKKSILRNADISYIWNGVDTQIFRHYADNDLAEKYDAYNKFIILGMANKWLLDVNAKVLDSVIEILNQNVKLMLIGCDEKQKAFLRKKSDYVIPIGYIQDRVELAKHYSLADVFVNVTHADTLPTVNMESICCGTPVITYDTCGSAELLGNNGEFIVKEDDTENLIKAIKNVMENKIEFQFNQQKFDKNENYKLYLKVYNKMVDLS